MKEPRLIQEGAKPEGASKLLKQLIPGGGRSHTPLKQGVNERASGFGESGEMK